MTENKANAQKGVTELEKYRRRIIRSTARLIREKKSPDEIWQIMKDETGCDCKNLWSRMRALTIKKLNRLIAANDRLDKIPAVARLTNTDWLLFDLTLVHEDIDVIGQKKILETGVEYKPLMDLFSLVQKFDIEDYILAERYDELPKAWALATLHYNQGSSGRMCSPMLLQKRWFQLKEVTRAKFYDFWKVYRGNMNNLKSAKFFVLPTKLQTAIAKRFQHLVTNNSLSWEEAYERKTIVSPEELTLMMKNPAGLTKSLDSDDNVPDLVLLEPVIETVTLDSDSENESKDKPSTSKEKITIKSESNIKKDVTEHVADFQIDEVNDARIEEIDEENFCSDNEEDRNLKTAQTFDETNDETAPEINNYLAITQETDEILGSYNMVDSTPQISNVVSLGKSSGNESVVKEIGSLIMPEEEENDTKIISDDEEAEDDVIITMPRMLFGDNERVNDSEKLNSEMAANVDLSKDVIDFHDDIEFVDDGTDESGNEEENGEQKAQDDDKLEMKIDPKLLMTVEVYTTKLDDMFVLKGNSFETISDSRIINSVLAQSKPVRMLKENMSTIQTAIGTNIEQNDDQIKVDNDDDTNENFKVSCTSKLLKKPISLNYNPIQLCKNPDFNTRLKRLTVGFFSSMRNRQQYKVCKPITIDVSKAFESKLVDGTLYLKNDLTLKEPCLKQENVDNHSSQQVSVLPSAMPAQSLIDHTIVNCTDDEVDLSKRNRAIKLQDIMQVRRINKNLLTAEITPICLSKPSVIPNNASVDTEHNIEAPKCYRDLNEENSKKDLLSAPFLSTSIPPTIKPSSSADNNIIDDKNNKDDKKIAQNLIKTANTLVPEFNKDLNNQTNQQINSLIQSNQLLTKDKSKKKTLTKKRPSINIPWFKRMAYTNVEESLLTLDTLNKMLIVLSGDDNPHTATKLEKKPKATTANTSNNPKPKTIPPPKKISQKKDKTSYCCWIGKKIKRPFSANRYHFCKAFNCDCCCKSRLESSIEHYKLMNQTDAVMQLTVFFRHFQKKYCVPPEEGILIEDQELTVNNPICNSPVINVDEDKTRVNSAKNSQQMSRINAPIPPLIPICKTWPAKSRIHEQALATSVSSSSAAYTVNTVSSSNEIPSIVISTKPVADNDASNLLVSAVTSISSPSSFSNNAISHEATSTEDLHVSNVLDVATVSNTLSVTGDNNVIDVSDFFGKPSFENSAPVSVRETTKCVTVPHIITSNISPTADEYRRNLIKRSNNKPLNPKSTCICLTPMFISSNNIIIDGTNICPVHKRPKSTEVKNNTKVLLLNKKRFQNKMPDSPVFLGDNQILLTTAKLPNKQNESMFPSQITVATVSDDLVPPGIQFLLLPDGRLTYTKDPNVEWTDQQAASLPLLVSSVQDQLKTALTTTLPKDSSMSNKSSPNETILVVDDTEEIETLNKNVKDPSNISNKSNLGNIISLIDKTDHINTPNRNPNEGQDQNLSTQQITSQEQANAELSGTPIENLDIMIKTSESQVANNIPVSNNIESSDPHDIQTENRITSAENNCTDDKNDCSGTTSNEISTNNADIVKKSILSDLMAMSGILTEDTKCISPKPSPVKVVFDTSCEKQNLAYNIQLQSTSIEEPNDNSKEICELYPVNSYAELKYACNVDGRFFKLDLQSGLITQIKVSISKKKNKSRNNPGLISNEVVDLTEYTSDPETSNVSTHIEDKRRDQIPAKRILDILKRRNVTILGSNKSAVDTHPVDIREKVKPTRLFKVSHTKRKGNNDHELTIMNIPKKKRKQQIEAKIDLVDSDTPMEEEYLLDSSGDDQENYISESDDEPLSVVAKRIHKPVAESSIQQTEVLTEDIIEDAVPEESTVNDSGIPIIHTEVAPVEDDAMETEAQPVGMIPMELFQNSDDGDDGEEDCILGF